MASPRVAVSYCSKLPDYEASVRAAGGEPVVVRADDSRVEDILATCDGVILSGGGDVDPAYYGAPPHRTFDAAEPGRDGFELDLARCVRIEDIPLLAICRGIQVLNV